MSKVLNGKRKVKIRNIKKFASKVILAVSTLTLLSACGGGSSSSTSTVTEPQPINSPPSIDSTQRLYYNDGAQMYVQFRIEVSDDKGIASIQWSQTSGIEVNMVGSTSREMRFAVPKVAHAQGEQELTFNVVVSDEQGATATADLSAVALPNNSIPVVRLGDNVIANANTQVTITANAFDTDGQIATFDWQQLSGQNVEFTGSGTHSIAFTTPSADESTTLSFQLTVTDDTGDSSTDEIDVFVNPIAFSAEQSIYAHIDSSSSLYQLSWFGENILVTMRSNSNGEYSQKVLKINDSQLVEDSQVQLTAFNSPHSWFTVDQNGDGYEDVVYTYQVSSSDIFTHAQIEIRYGSQNGNFSEPKVMGVYNDGDSRWNVARMVDVNGDGHLDLAIHDNWNEPVEFWLTYRPNTDTYEVLDNQDMLMFDSNGFSRVAEKLFADIDGDGRNEIFGLGNFENCILVGNCGYLRFAQLGDDGLYQDWQMIDERILQAKGRHLRDVDLDGLDDLIFSGYEEPANVVDNETEHRMWFKYTPQLGFTEHSMESMPRYYVDLFNTGSAYFVDIDTIGKLTTYRYDSVIKAPVEDRSFAINSGNFDNVIFVDVDKDSDLDLVYINNAKDGINWIENNLN